MSVTQLCRHFLTPYKNRETYVGVCFTCSCSRCSGFKHKYRLGYTRTLENLLHISISLVWHWSMSVRIYIYYVPHHGNYDECWNDCQWYNAMGWGRRGHSPSRLVCSDKHMCLWTLSCHCTNRPIIIKLSSNVMTLSCLKFKSQTKF